MKTRRHYRAFTLLELTIAMLIAAVCMGMAFYVLQTFNRIGIAQQQDKQAGLALQRFHQRMQHETQEATAIQFTDNILRLVHDGYQTQYLFLDSVIVRYQEETATDTLFGQIHHLTVRYMDSLPAEMVNYCGFELQIEDKVYPFTLRKRYSAEELVHLSPAISE